MRKIPVGILGASGLLGQQYAALLTNHPWFELTFRTSSHKNDLYYSLDDIKIAKEKCRLLFSALPNALAEIYEERYADAGLGVISNASVYRMTPDVPLLIPEINYDHLKLIEIQRKNRNWDSGFLIVKPNCSIQSFMIPLTPLHHRFRVIQLFVTTLQAISGAGNSGLSSYAIQDNVIPFIPQEEEKSEAEPLKIWDLTRDALSISAQCNRVPVLDGHLACISVKFERCPEIKEILDIWKNYRSLPQELKLPSAPSFPIIYREEQERPQTRLDRDSGKGMAVTVGRLRECPLLDIKFAGLSHNAIRGGAGGALLIAELLKSQNYL